MLNGTKAGIKAMLRKLGYDLVRYPCVAPGTGLPSDFSDADRRDYDAVAYCTMVPPERIYTLVRAVEYVVKANIEGALVECGTWKGGCALSMARTLKKLEAYNREIFLYDLFGEAWPSASEFDIHGGVSQLSLYESGEIDDGGMQYTLEEVKKNILSGGFPEENIRFVAGDILKTIPENIPEKISLLRLDTDFYESTLHELEHLYPRLVEGGVLIVDDYGDWEGSRKAVDEYFQKRGESILLIRVDVGARMAIKVSR